MEKIKENIDKQIPSEESFLNWNLLSKEIKSILGDDIYKSWIQKLVFKKEFNHYVILSAPTRFIRDWIVSRYADKILDVIKNFKKEINRIEFVVEEVDFKDSINNQSLKLNGQSNLLDNITPIENSILNYNRLDPKKNFNNFITGESNQLAYIAAQKICEQISHYNPLFIYGGIGMGKTHLLNSVGFKMQEKFKVMFISAERFMYHFIKSIKNNAMVSFKDFFRKADVFIIDDIQFVRGKEAMQEEFFHTFNDLMDRGSQIVISSDRAPANLDRIQGRIKSRLSGGLVVDIQPSDFNLRLKIVKNKFLEIKKNFTETIDLSDEVFNFIASEMRISVRETLGGLNRVLAFSKIYNKSPNSSECKIILKDLINTNQNQINIEDIQNIVALHYKISLNEMLSPRRSRSLVRPRQVAMYLTKKYTSKSLPDIGRKFSGRDHTTVIHAVKTIEKLLQKDQDIYQAMEEIKKKILKVN